MSGVPRQPMFNVRFFPGEREKLAKLARGLKLSQAAVLRLALFRLWDDATSGRVKSTDKDVEYLRH